MLDNSCGVEDQVGVERFVVAGDNVENRLIEFVVYGDEQGF